MRKKRNVPLTSKAWAQIREAKLAEEPLCRYCLQLGNIVPATDVDHIDNDMADYSDVNALSDLQSLCHSCHSVKTWHETQPKGNPNRGCDINGIPRDPNHPWNLEVRSKS